MDRAGERRATRASLGALGQASVLALVAACAHAAPDPAGVRPDVRGAEKSLATELVAAGELDRALAVVNQLDPAGSGDAEVLTLRGIIYRDEELWPEAEHDLRAALAIDDDLAGAHAVLGTVLDLTARSAEAEAHHRRAVALAPRIVAYRNNLALSLQAAGKLRDAIAEYRQAIELDPLNPTVRNNAGFAYAEAGDMRQASIEFARGGSAAEALNNLGFAYERGGNLKQAYDSYAAALRLDPSLVRARRNLEHVAEALGRPLPDAPGGPSKEQPP